MDDELITDLVGLARRPRCVPDRQPPPSAPYEPKPHTTPGRDTMLERLGALVSSAEGRVVVGAVEGAGGVGKTSVAAALVEAHSGDFEIVWWVRSEDPALVVADLAELAPHLDVAILDDVVDTAAAVCRQLAVTERRWLVVFDNASDQRSIVDWCPKEATASS